MRKKSTLALVLITTIPSSHLTDIRPLQKGECHSQRPTEFEEQIIVLEVLAEPLFKLTCLVFHLLCMKNKNLRPSSAVLACTEIIALITFSLLFFIMTISFSFLFFFFFLLSFLGLKETKKNKKKKTWL